MFWVIDDKFHRPDVKRLGELRPKKHVWLLFDSREYTGHTLYHLYRSIKPTKTL